MGLSALASDPVPAIALLAGGLISIFIAVYGKRDDTHIDELATTGGFILGAVMIVMAILVAYYETVTWFSLIMLFVVALTLALRPLKDVPIAAIIGLIVASVVTFVVSIFITTPVLGVEEWKILAIIFAVVAFIVWLMFRFAEDLLKLARMILDWKPVAIVTGVVAAVEGVLMLLNSSLAQLF